MCQIFQIHPDDPQLRLIRRAVEIIERGGLIVYPTDSSYALGCHIGDKKALDRIRSIRKVDKRHNFTLVCRDLSDISNYAKLDNSSYRLIKALTPGPYTFILPATREVPRRLQNPKRKTIGMRIPDNVIVQLMLETLGQPIMSSTLILPNDDMPMTDPYEIQDLIGHRVELIIDGGYCGFEATTVVDMVEGYPRIVRRGKGDTAAIENPHEGHFLGKNIH